MSITTARRVMLRTRAYLRMIIALWTRSRRHARRYVTLFCYPQHSLRCGVPHLTSHFHHFHTSVKILKTEGTRARPRYSWNWWPFDLQHMLPSQIWAFLMTRVLLHRQRTRFWQRKSLVNGRMRQLIRSPLCSEYLKVMLNTSCGNTNGEAG